MNNKLTRGQKSADWLARWAGSWTFILIFSFFLILWVLFNTIFIIFGVWDKYPFILLNLFLSCIAAIQAPIILMSQNRQGEEDRKRAKYDYLVNRKAEREIKELQIDVLEIKEAVLKQSTEKEKTYLKKELNELKEELEKIEKKF